MDDNNMQPVAQPTPAPTPVSTMTPAPAPKAQGGMGPLVGIIIIVLVLAAGGLYVWYTKAAPAPVENKPQATAQDTAEQQTAAAASSDAASTLEADLQATDTGDAAGELQVQ